MTLPQNPAPLALGCARVECGVLQEAESRLGPEDSLVLLMKSAQRKDMQIHVSAPRGGVHTLQRRNPSGLRGGGGGWWLVAVATGAWQICGTT